MKYLVFSLCLFLSGCASDYKLVQTVDQSASCVDKIKPDGVETAWYTASVDVVGKHFSGLVLIKKMEDQSFRFVFTNEAGVTFFDFEFQRSGEFRVKKIIKQLDRKPVIETLRKDFALLLGIPFRAGKETSFKSGEEIFYGVKQKKETAYFITGEDCASLRRLELGSSRKRKVSITQTGDKRNPDEINIKHHTFDMVIDLKRLERE